MQKSKKNRTYGVKKWLISGVIATGSIILFSPTAYADIQEELFLDYCGCEYDFPRDYANIQGELTGSNVRVREYPSIDSDSNILLQADRGQAIEVVDIAGDFYRVNIQNYSDVYIHREFVNLTETIGTAMQDDVPVVNAPESHELLGIIRRGDQLQVTGQYRNWYEVTFNGERGFVESGFIIVQFGESLSTVRPPGGSGASNSRSADFIGDLIAYSKTYLGIPYRFGSMDPSRGLDCSAFVVLVMRQFDINLHRTSASMASSNGTYVSRNALQAGDLVFFATSGGRRVSHVGIYIGNNQFIHSATIGGVMVSGMNEQYWRTRFVRANRVI
ncbi:MAG: C40 family peptidase [Defluviitaleaceae bacterium]|nr:C40 family peptidase [Defluviitaleaceae bacterium]